MFVGPGLTSFEQLAAGARRRGLATAWVDYPGSARWRRLRTRAFVPRVLSADGDVALAAQLRRLGVERIVDVHASEYVLHDVVSAAHDAGLPAPLLADLDRRLLLTDKLVMSRLLDREGVAVPTALDAREHDAAEAVARLGLPLMVKGRVGNGGSAVLLARSEAEATQAEARVRPHGGALFERYVDGEPVSYSAVYDGSGVLREAVYLTERLHPEQLGPPDRIRLLPGEAERRVGRRVVSSLGGSGLVNVNLLTDRDGRCWVHDVNLRPWGTLWALHEAGIDFTEPYFALRGLLPAAPATPVATSSGGTFAVFPAAAIGVAESDALGGLLTFLSQVPDYWRWTGGGYLLAELARATAQVGRARLGRLRR